MCCMYVDYGLSLVIEYPSTRYVCQYCSWSNNFSLSPFAADNMVLRDSFEHLVPLILHIKAESGAYSRAPQFSDHLTRFALLYAFSNKKTETVARALIGRVIGVFFWGGGVDPPKCFTRIKELSSKANYPSLVATDDFWVGKTRNVRFRSSDQVTLRPNVFTPPCTLCLRSVQQHQSAELGLMC